MFPQLNQTLQILSKVSIPKERMALLEPLIDYIKQKGKEHQPVRLHFICTHNSRRSHLAQVWAQTMAHYWQVKDVACYSGGTEATALFPKVAETLSHQGFSVQKLSDEDNPIYAVKFDENEPAVMGFSKTFEHPFNPVASFAAIMTCSSADEDCPFIAGAEKRLPIRYDDPKAFDGTELMDARYAERSLQIAAEMYYVFSQIP